LRPPVRGLDRDDNLPDACPMLRERPHPAVPDGLADFVQRVAVVNFADARRHGVGEDALAGIHDHHVAALPLVQRGHNLLNGGEGELRRPRREEA